MLADLIYDETAIFIQYGQSKLVGIVDSFQAGSRQQSPLTQDRRDRRRMNKVKQRL